MFQSPIHRGTSINDNESDYSYLGQVEVFNPLFVGTLRSTKMDSVPLPGEMTQAEFRLSYSSGHFDPTR